MEVFKARLDEALTKSNSIPVRKLQTVQGVYKSMDAEGA